MGECTRTRNLNAPMAGVRLLAAQSSVRAKLAQARLPDSNVASDRIIGLRSSRAISDARHPRRGGPRLGRARKLSGRRSQIVTGTFPEKEQLRCCKPTTCRTFRNSCPAESSNGSPLVPWPRPRPSRACSTAPPQVWGRHPVSGDDSSPGRDGRRRPSRARALQWPRGGDTAGEGGYFWPA